MTKSEETNIELKNPDWVLSKWFEHRVTSYDSHTHNLNNYSKIYFFEFYNQVTKEIIDLNNKEVHTVIGISHEKSKNHEFFYPFNLHENLALNHIETGSNTFIKVHSAKTFKKHKYIGRIFLYPNIGLRGLVPIKKFLNYENEKLTYVKKRKKLLECFKDHDVILNDCIVSKVIQLKIEGINSKKCKCIFNLYYCYNFCKKENFIISDSASEMFLEILDNKPILLMKEK